MVDWVDGDYARSGVAVWVNPDDHERALNFLLHEDNNSVDMLNDAVIWGAYGDYSWKTGEWYTITLEAKGSLLTGRIQKTGTNENPYVLIWDDGYAAMRSPGFPGLTGSTMLGLTAQFDNFQVIVDGKVVFFDNFDSTPVSDWQLQ